MLFAGSCARREQRNVTRYAIVPFENLTGDSSLDWAGPALSAILTAEISGSTLTLPLRVNQPREAALVGAQRSLQGYYTRANGELRFTGVLRDGASGKNAAWYQAVGTTATLADAATSIAKQTGERLRPWGSHNAEALRLWGEAMNAQSPADRAQKLDAAIQLDPNFGAAYVDLAQTLSAAGEGGRLRTMLASAKQRISQFNDVDRARVELFDSEVTGDTGERRQSLIALSRLISTDPAPLRALAVTEFQSRHFAGAAEAYKAALALDPDSPEILNELGYIYAFAGNPEQARAALERYRVLQPDQANPFDSMGEASYLMGRFAEAEQEFLKAQSKAPAQSIEFLKVAQARLMQDNIPGADEAFDKYLAPRRALHDPQAELQRFQWLHHTGRRQQAEAGLNATTSTTPTLAAYAEVQLAVWLLEAGKRDAAKALATKAMQTAADPVVRNAAGVCAFLAESRSTPEAWREAFERIAPNTPVTDNRRMVLAYGLLFSGMFAPAADVLKPIFDATSPASDGRVRALYAWALVASGQQKTAAALLEAYPIPWSSGDALFVGSEFPRFLELRSKMLRDSGRTQEAERLAALARKF